MPNSDLHSLGRVIAKKRVDAELSASELGRRAGVQPSTITRLEAGAIQPRPDTVASIARVLGVPVSDLYVAADWLPKNELPSVTPYLRSKFRGLPAAAQREIEASVNAITEKYGYDSAGPQPGEDEA